MRFTAKQPHPDFVRIRMIYIMLTAMRPLVIPVRVHSVTPEVES